MLEFRVTSIGAQAAAVLDQARENSATGSVVAIADRSCHLLLPGGLVCLVSDDIGNGPINLVCHTAVASGQTGVRDLFGSLQRHDRVVMNGTRLAIGDQIVLQMQAVTIWESTFPTVSVPVRCALENVNALAELAPPDSLMALVRRNPGTTINRGSLSAVEQATLEYLREPVIVLAADLYQRRHPAVSNAGSSQTDWSPSVELLIGAGKGLTPAGDDLLAGVLLTLHFLGRRNIAQSLFDRLEPILKHRTTTLSSILLSLAAKATAGEAMIQLFRHLNTSTQFDRPGSAMALGDIGHTSGWDTLAGVQLTLAAFTGSAATTQIVTTAPGRRLNNRKIVHA